MSDIAVSICNGEPSLTHHAGQDTDLHRDCERFRIRFLRAYIESNLAFMREHRNYRLAILRSSAHAQQQIGDVDEAVRVLEQNLARYQSEGQLRPDFDPLVVAPAIRAGINAVLLRLAHNLDLDLDSYAGELVDLFHWATRLDPQA